jgi:hypothetical protein
MARCVGCVRTSSSLDAFCRPRDRFRGEEDQARVSDNRETESKKTILHNCILNSTT